MAQGDERQAGGESVGRNGWRGIEEMVIEEEVKAEGSKDGGNTG